MSDLFAFHQATPTLLSLGEGTSSSLPLRKALHSSDRFCRFVHGHLLPQPRFSLSIDHLLRYSSRRNRYRASHSHAGNVAQETPLMAINSPLDRKLRMGLVGGGQGAFIGRVHAMAAILDNRATLVAGALSSDPARARASAPDYDIPPERAYGSYKEMVEKESRLPADQRIDFVSVATPNHTHFE